MAFNEDKQIVVVCKKLFRPNTQSISNIKNETVILDYCIVNYFGNCVQCKHGCETNNTTYDATEARRQFLHESGSELSVIVKLINIIRFSAPFCDTNGWISDCRLWIVASVARARPVRNPLLLIFFVIGEGRVS